MDVKCTWQNAMIELHTARNAESTEKLMSPQVLTPPLRSLFVMYGSKSAIWIVIISFITKDFTQKWSQLSLHTGVVTSTDY